MMRDVTMRLFAILLVAGTLAGCNGARDLGEAPVPLGDFSLHHNIVVAPKAVKGPLSRELPKEVLTKAVQDAIAERFDRYEGARRYHFGVSIEGYVLAQPGVPLVLAPKSILVLNVTVWDDAANRKLNEKPHQITVLESLDQGPLVGSGYTKTAEEQMKNLSQNAAKSIETWLVKQNKAEGWFEGAAAE